MTTVEECPVCKKPIYPNASDYMLRSGSVCTCGSTMPAARTHSPAQPPKQVKAVPVGVQRITLPYPPTANNFKVPVVRGGRTQFVLSEEARVYKSFVQWKVSEAHFNQITGGVKVTMRFYRPRKRGDVDNSIKLCLDALTGYAYEDDEQVVEIHAYRYEDKDNPRVEIEVEEAGNG